MLNYFETKETLNTIGVDFSIEEYIFCVSMVLGDDIYTSYALAFDPKGLKKVVGTEQEKEFLQSLHHDADLLVQQQNIVKLKGELEDALNIEIQNRALNLENYRFTGGQIAQILQNLLHNRISDLDSASTKDVISLIKLLTEQFGLEGSGEFERHFVQIYPKFNALCRCGREFDVAKGLDCVCPHCGQVYRWVNEEDRFYPAINKL